MFASRTFHGIKTKRRAVSQIIGSVMMVAIVASVGGILLFQGMNGINSFNQYLQDALQQQSGKSQESFIIEHVRFDTNSKNVEITVRNTGFVDLYVNKIVLVRVNTQELVIYSENRADEVFMTDMKTITIPATISDSNFGSPSSYGTANYNLAVTTSEGNLAQSSVTPYNT